MSATLTRQDPTFALAVTAAGVAGVGGLAAIALAEGGTPCWLQGAIYLLAGVPLARGLKGLLAWRWYGEGEGYRRGVLLVAVALGLAWHGWGSVRAHQAKVAAEEQELAPLIDALAAHHRAKGEYPARLADLGEREPELPPSVKPRYLALGGQSYELAFRHNLVVTHRYDPVTARWSDAF